MRELVPMYLELFEPSRVEFMISQIEREIGMEFPEKKYNMRNYLYKGQLNLMVIQ